MTNKKRYIVVGDDYNNCVDGGERFLIIIIVPCISQYPPFLHTAPPPISSHPMAIHITSSDSLSSHTYSGSSPSRILVDVVLMHSPQKNTTRRDPHVVSVVSNQCMVCFLQDLKLHWQTKYSHHNHSVQLYSRKPCTQFILKW